MSRAAETEWIKYEVRKKERDDADERLNALKTVLGDMLRDTQAALPETPSLGDLALLALIEFALAATDHREIGRALVAIERRLKGTDAGPDDDERTGAHEAPIPTDLLEVLPQAYFEPTTDRPAGQNGTGELGNALTRQTRQTETTDAVREPPDA